MKKKRKADAVNIGLEKTFELVQIYQTLFEFDISKRNANGQCIRCGSDYMRFSLNEFCQNCIQRVEFISREHPHVLEKIRTEGKI